MKETIYTIPVSEVFEKKCGCPLCSMLQTLEQKWAEYITGAAMMEPDVRIETNEQGFCMRHYQALLGQRNRLAAALMLQSRIAHLQSTALQGNKKSWFQKAQEPTGSCFLCGKIAREMDRLAGNVAVMWAREEQFRTLFASQQYLCLPHAGLLYSKAGSLKGRDRAGLEQATRRLAMQEMDRIKADIDAYCGLYDYRSAHSGPAPDHISNAIEQAIAFLQGTC